MVNLEQPLNTSSLRWTLQEQQQQTKRENALAKATDFILQGVIDIPDTSDDDNKAIVRSID